ncbi:hypothetical protein PMAYCL1PPCAC_20313 [Pristionchus mayeri]|uniref:protein-disulfide reductase n=1 Tax=Pristionchus mayeri TaxID=1317129 RepID=A0AAN5CST9_9BILA|nr:hypothetical protein PMAYCL1PPCAC_20313 [Pristionchus mayeri]
MIKYSTLIDHIELIRDCSFVQMVSLFAGHKLFKNRGGEVDVSVLEGKTLGVFFGTLWSPHSRTFTSTLAKFYNELKQKGTPFEVVFASLDESEMDAQIFLAEDQDNWYYLGFYDPLIKQLNEMHHPGHVDRLPVLLILNSDGAKVTDQGVADIMSGKPALAVYEGWKK